MGGKCEICNEPVDGRRTCGKTCLKELQRRITKSQFSDPEKRKRHSDATVAAMSRLDMKTIVNENRRSYKGENHPSYGMERSIEWRTRISEGNKGILKGKTWNEIMGPERSAERRDQNRSSMIKINEKLLNDKKSSLEVRLSVIFPTFKTNERVGNYVADLIDLESRLILEANGDYWHANPKYFSSGDLIPSLGITAEEKWRLDAQRERDLRSLGFNVVIMWESDINSMSDDQIKEFVSKAAKIR